MAVDFLLKLGDIKGEGMGPAPEVPGHFAQDHKNDWIEVITWSWGMAQTGTRREKPGGGAGKIAVQDLTFSHWVDSASADIFRACVTGQLVKKAMLACHKPGAKERTPYLIITLEDVLVTNINVGGTEGKEHATEQVTLNFATFLIEYWMQEPNGTFTRTNPFGWKIRESEELRKQTNLPKMGGPPVR
jgi:type VI secretion system secreted protein Hcp